MLTLDAPLSFFLFLWQLITGSKKRARWLQARRIFSPSCPNLRIPNRFLREGTENTWLLHESLSLVHEAEAAIGHI